MQLLIMHRIYQFTFNNFSCIIISVYDNTYFVVNHKIFFSIAAKLYGGNQSTSNYQSSYLGTCVTNVKWVHLPNQREADTVTMGADATFTVLSCPTVHSVLWVGQDMYYCTFIKSCP